MGVSQTKVALDPAIEALIKIAHGRTDCGRPLPAEDARQEARSVLVRLGISWGGHREKR